MQTIELELPLRTVALAALRPTFQKSMQNPPAHLRGEIIHHGLLCWRETPGSMMVLRLAHLFATATSIPAGLWYTNPSEKD